MLKRIDIGDSPSGKATDSDSVIRGFKSLVPSQKKKRNLSTTTFCVFLRPFGVFRGFSGFLSLKTGFRAASQLFRSPFFCFPDAKTAKNAGVLFAFLSSVKESKKC